MTPEKDALEEARRAGFDLSLLDVTLALSTEERWRQHDTALDLALELVEAKEARDARLRSAAAKAS
jgi:hypothetical protein